VAKAKSKAKSGKAAKAVHAAAEAVEFASETVGKAGKRRAKANGKAAAAKAGGKSKAGAKAKDRPESKAKARAKAEPGGRTGAGPDGTAKDRTASGAVPDVSAAPEVPERAAAAKDATPAGTVPAAPASGTVAAPIPTATATARSAAAAAPTVATAPGPAAPPAASRAPALEEVRVSELLRLPPGPVDLSALDPAATPGAPGDRDATRTATAALGERIAQLQEKLWADSRRGGTRRLLLVLQGMDTSGKGGTVKHAAGEMNPAGVRVVGFKAPTPEERQHDFLWRVRANLPRAGEVGIFDRSHYEDVIVVRVHGLAPRATWARRYSTINRFERGLVQSGCAVVKVFLHLSEEEQKKRLRARLEDPTKHWKYNPGDIDERGRWDDYRTAYEVALEKCGTDEAPWFVVPADRKWYRNWAVTNLVLEHLEAMDLDWPAADFDVAEELRRLDES
jgi:PPK2 family polyphosphate:nucleotide phosphotransferase